MGKLLFLMPSPPQPGSRPFGGAGTPQHLPEVCLHLAPGVENPVYFLIPGLLPGPQSIHLPWGLRKLRGLSEDGRSHTPVSPP